jgi:hypothetical protein
MISIEWLEPSIIFSPMLTPRCENLQHRVFPGLPGLCAVENAVAELALAGAEARGAVFTRSEVVDFILDLVGYTIDRPLSTFRVLEPSMGQADFLVPVITRLIASYRATGRQDFVADLSDCIRAVELHRTTFEGSQEAVIRVLLDQGVSARVATHLAKCWLRQGDFLLEPFDGSFTHVVGNPPYVRQEMIPEALMEEYRRRFQTIYDRADIYIPFIERSLSLLAAGGTLGFICADRWTKNRYGGPLRGYVAKGFHLKAFVDMVDTPAFTSDVIAYPAIIVIKREKAGPTRVAFRPEIERATLHRLAHQMTSARMTAGKEVSEIALVPTGDRPWMLEKPHLLNFMRRLEEGLPTLEEAGCKVGIGVATGADRVFIAPFEELDVEADRKLPLVTTRDIQSGSVKWHGLGVLNPFEADGGVVDLERYPKFARYLDLHAAAIKARHVSKRNPKGWFRTIDRIYPKLTSIPKLLIPDIKGQSHIVFEPGKLYPHHNLYFVTSEEWDLRALQAVLLSAVTQAFISAYSTKMRGGFLRFQAQYLRRIRIPRWSDVKASFRAELSKAAKAGDLKACNEAAYRLYGLSPSEKKALTPNADAT